MVSSFTLTYPKKKDTLEKKKKRNRVVIRLTVQKKEVNFFAVKKQRRYLERMCRLLPFCEWWSNSVSCFQNVLERTWNAGTIHRETVNQTSFWPGALWEGILEQYAI